MKTMRLRNIKAPCAKCGALGRKRATPNGSYVACSVHFIDDVTPQINDYAAQLLRPGRPRSANYGRGADKRKAKKGLFAGAHGFMPGLTAGERAARKKARNKRKALARRMA